MVPSPHLVLLGGGHAMLPSLRRAQEWTEAGIEVTLVDPQQWLYYSGMVPEFLGGVYDVEDIRIDLARLVREAEGHFVQEKAAALDPDRRVVMTESGTEISFDVLGIDVGAVNPAVPEAAVATKPIYRIRALEPYVRTVLDTSSAELCLVIVGAGAAGVEVALNLTGRFQGADRIDDLELTLVEQTECILPGFPEGMRRYAARLLQDRGATIRTSTSVEAVERNGDTAAVQVTDAEGMRSTLSAGAVLWATGTVGPSLLRESGLSTDDRGFLHTTAQLRTPTHPRIFAAGDCATISDLDLAKVGVHAVKQGTDLRTNIDRTLQKLAADDTVPRPQQLARFRPYPVAPLILSTGAREGLWTAGPLWAAHSGLLRLKHWIDRRWIRTYAPDRWGGASGRTLLGAESANEPTE